MPACGYSVTRCVRQHIRLYPSASSSPSITGALPGSIAAYSGRQSCCAANRSRKRLITVRTSARSWLIKAPHVKHVNSAGCLAGATPVKRGRSIYITLQSIVAGPNSSRSIVHCGNQRIQIAAAKRAPSPHRVDERKARRHCVAALHGTRRGGNQRIKVDITDCP